MQYRYLTSDRICFFVFEGSQDFFKLLLHQYPDVFERILRLDALDLLRVQDEKYVCLPNREGTLIFEKCGHRIMVRYALQRDANFSEKFREVLGEIFEEIDHVEPESHEKI